MARKADLRLQRAGTVINLKSAVQETTLGRMSGSSWNFGAVLTV